MDALYLWALIVGGGGGVAESVSEYKDIAIHYFSKVFKEQYSRE